MIIAYRRQNTAFVKYRVCDRGELRVSEEEDCVDPLRAAQQSYIYNKYCIQIQLGPLCLGSSRKNSRLQENCIL